MQKLSLLIFTLILSASLLPVYAATKSYNNEQTLILQAQTLLKGAKIKDVLLSIMNDQTWWTLPDGHNVLASGPVLSINVPASFSPVASPPIESSQKIVSVLEDMLIKKDIHEIQEIHIRAQTWRIM